MNTSCHVQRRGLISRLRRRLGRTLADKPFNSLAHLFGCDVFPLAVDLLSSQIVPVSFAREEQLIQKFLGHDGSYLQYLVDIAASDGIAFSNSYNLVRSGWHGLLIEGAGDAFAALAREHVRHSQVSLMRTIVTPDNVCALLTAAAIPKEFGFLSLDIDGYDYFVLQRLLQAFRPSLVCLEINERVPPPLQFTVLFDLNHTWRGDNLFGQSISQVELLCQEFDYAILELEYNNLFIVPRERLGSQTALSAEQAFRTGFLERKDRLKRFPWNTFVEHLYALSPDEAYAELKKSLIEYEGRYSLLNPRK